MFGSAEAEGLFRTLRARSVPGRWHLLRGWHTARRASGPRQGFPGISPRLIWGCTVRQKGGAAGGLSAYSGQGAYWEDGISSGADTLPGGLPGSGRIPRYMGNTTPKQTPPPHRSCRAAGVFSCMGTGRIRLRHRATWRQWDSRERRLPKPGRQ